MAYVSNKRPYSRLTRISFALAAASLVSMGAGRVYDYATRTERVATVAKRIPEQLSKAGINAKLDLFPPGNSSWFFPATIMYQAGYSVVDDPKNPMDLYASLVNSYYRIKGDIYSYQQVKHLPQIASVVGAFPFEVNVMDMCPADEKFTEGYREFFRIFAAYHESAHAVDGARRLTIKLAAKKIAQFVATPVANTKKRPSEMESVINILHVAPPVSILTETLADGAALIAVKALYANDPNIDLYIKRLTAGRMVRSNFGDTFAKDKSHNSFGYLEKLIVSFKDKKNGVVPTDDIVEATVRAAEFMDKNYDAFAKYLIVSSAIDRQDIYDPRGGLARDTKREIMNWSARANEIKRTMCGPA
jgi:hypothetical protein